LDTSQHVDTDTNPHAAKRRTDREATPGDRLEDGLRVGQRASDDPEDLTGCGLPRQCLTHRCGRLAGHARLLLQLIEQPNVLDSDHGLVGACLEKRDVFVTKGLGLPDADRTDWTTLAENRDEDS